MKKIILLIAISAISFKSMAQVAGPVVDAALAASIAGAAASDRIAYNNITEEEKKTNESLATVMVLQANMLEIQKKTIKYMSTLQSELKNLYSLELIIQATIQTGKNLDEAAEIAADDPKLLMVVSETMVKFGEEVLELREYIEKIVKKDGETNLMSNADRISVINHVKQKIYKLRGISSQLIYRMKAAKRYGLFRFLCPREFYYVRHSEALVNKIINNFHF